MTPLRLKFYHRCPSSLQGVGLSHGASFRGHGEEAEGACGPSPGRSGAEAGEGPAECPPAGRPQPGSHEQLSGRSSIHQTVGADCPDTSHTLSSARLKD